MWDSCLHWVMTEGVVSRESMEGGEMKGSDGTLKILRVKGQEGEEGPAQETQQEWEK